MDREDTTPTRFKRWMRFIAVILVGAFIHQDIIWAQDFAPVRPQKGQGGSFSFFKGGDVNGSIDIPEDIASIRESWSPDKRLTINDKRSTIINIQDAHAYLGAQESIASLLGKLVSDYNIRVIAVEGSSGYIDTSLLSTFPDRKVRDNTARDLMKEGRMSAGEFFSITSDRPVALYGIEEDALYRKNVDEFRKLFESGKTVANDISSTLGLLRSISDRAYSDDLKRLEKGMVLYRDGKVPFRNFWDILLSLARKYALRPDNHKNLSRLAELTAEEDRIDFTKANSERELLIGELSKRLSKEPLKKLLLELFDFKQGKISSGDFHKKLAGLALEHGIDVSQYPSLGAYTSYITGYESIDIVEIFKELKSYSALVKERLFRNDQERMLDRCVRFFEYAGGIFSLKLDNGEFGDFLKFREGFSEKDLKDTIAALSRKYGIDDGSCGDIDRIFGQLPGAVDFYRTAERRNRAMIENTIRRMASEGEDAAALITGGYHTQGLTGILKSRQCSYLVILPKFDASKGERPYVTILTNKKGPYEPLLKSGQYHLAASAYFQHDPFRSEDDKFLDYSEVFSKALLEVADGIEDDAERNRVVAMTVNQWIDNYKSFHDSFVADQSRRMTPIDYRPRDVETVRRHLESLSQNVLKLPEPIRLSQLKSYVNKEAIFGTVLVVIILSLAITGKAPISLQVCSGIFIGLIYAYALVHASVAAVIKKAFKASRVSILDSSGQERHIARYNPVSEDVDYLWYNVSNPDDVTYNPERKVDSYFRVIDNISDRSILGRLALYYIAMHETSHAAGYGDRVAFLLPGFGQGRVLKRSNEAFVGEVVSALYTRSDLSNAELIGKAKGDKDKLFALAQRLESNIDEFPEVTIKARAYLLIGHIYSQYSLFGRAALTERKYTELALRCIKDAVRRSIKMPSGPLRIPEEFNSKEVVVSSPIRVDLSHGGASDLFAMTYERGGRAVNIAFDLDGEAPIKVRVRRIEEPLIRIISKDLDIEKVMESTAEILSYHDKKDPLRLFKAAFVVSGIISASDERPLGDILKSMGGGIELQVESKIPRGSGLGGSSILDACVLAGLFAISGQEKEREEIVNATLYLEHMLDIGGGWQDPVGGIFGGIKSISSKAGIANPVITGIDAPEEFISRLEDRAVLYYIGKSHFAGDILQKLVIDYITRHRVEYKSRERLAKMDDAFVGAIKEGDIDKLGALTSEFWDEWKTLNPEASDKTTDEIFESVSDLIVGGKLCGAGGGGFALFIAKEGKKGELEDRLNKLRPDVPWARTYKGTVNRTGINVEVRPIADAQKFQAFIDPRKAGAPYHTETGFTVRVKDEERHFNYGEVDKALEFVKAGRGLRSMNIAISKPVAGPPATFTFQADNELLALLDNGRYRIELEKLVEEAIKARGPNGFSDLAGRTITIALLDKSQSIFEDHTKDNFIGINRALFDMVAPEISKESFEILLAVGITHELSHEAGNVNEGAITREDIDLVLALISQNTVDMQPAVSKIEEIAIDESLFVRGLKRISVAAPADIGIAQPDAVISGSSNIVANSAEMLARLKSIAKNIAVIEDPELADFKAKLCAALEDPSRLNANTYLAFMSRYKQYMEGDERQKAAKLALGMEKKERIAYFSLEYGLSQWLNIYSGGLGILSGDTLWAANDRYPQDTFVAVGLAYHTGYFEQYIVTAEDHRQGRYRGTSAGGQVEYYKKTPFEKYGETAKDENGKEIVIKVEATPGRFIYAKIWRIRVGRVNLYLLDTDIDENDKPELSPEPFVRGLTYNLYARGKDEHGRDYPRESDSWRFKQELLLGVGGVRALQAMGHKIAVLHMNEGHSALSAIELIRQELEERADRIGIKLSELNDLIKKGEVDRELLINNGVTFLAARDAVKTKMAFTSHTPIPDGNEEYDVGLFRWFFDNYAALNGMDIEDILGISKYESEVFGKYMVNLSKLALNTSRYSNGVSKKHGEVSRQLYHSDAIDYITNSVHRRFWQSTELQCLLAGAFAAFKKAKALTADKRLEDLDGGELKALMDGIDNASIRSTLDSARESAIAKLKELRGVELDKDAFIIVFARRSAAYKRPDLILPKIDALIEEASRLGIKVQVVFAAKAHPNDGTGKAIIKRINDFISKYPGTAFFIENYNIPVSRELTKVASVWLNNPIPPLEASGTSGMKSAMNGVVSLSTPDGWPLEAEGALDALERGDPLSATGAAVLFNESALTDPFERDNETRENMYAAMVGLMGEFALEKDKWAERSKNVIRDAMVNFAMERFIDQYETRAYKPAIGVQPAALAIAQPRPLTDEEVARGCMRTGLFYQNGSLRSDGNMIHSKFTMLLGGAIDLIPQGFLSRLRHLCARFKKSLSDPPVRIVTAEKLGTNSVKYIDTWGNAYIVFDADFVNILTRHMHRYPDVVRRLMYERLRHELAHSNSRLDLQSRIKEEARVILDVDLALKRELQEDKNKALRRAINKFFSIERPAFLSGRYYGDERFLGRLAALSPEDARSAALKYSAQFYNSFKGNAMALPIDVPPAGEPSLADIKSKILKDLEERKALIEAFRDSLPEELKKVKPVAVEFAKVCLEEVFAEGHVIRQWRRGKLNEEILHLWILFNSAAEAGRSGGKEYYFFVNQKQRPESEGGNCTEILAATPNTGSESAITEPIKGLGMEVAGGFRHTYEDVAVSLYQIQEPGTVKDALSGTRLAELIGKYTSDPENIFVEAEYLALAENDMNDAVRICENALYGLHRCDSNNIPGGVLNGVVWNYTAAEQDIVAIDGMKSRYSIRRRALNDERVHFNSVVRPYQHNRDRMIARASPQALPILNLLKMIVDDATSSVRIERGQPSAAVQMRGKYESITGFFEKSASGAMGHEGESIKSMLAHIIKSLDRGYSLMPNEVEMEAEKLYKCYTLAKEHIRGEKELSLAEEIYSGAIQIITGYDRTARFALWKWLEDNYPSGSSDVLSRSTAERIVNEICDKLEIEDVALEGIEEIAPGAKEKGKSIIVVSRDLVRDELILRALTEKYGVKYFVCCNGSTQEHLGIMATASGAMLLVGLPDIVFDRLVRTGESASVYASDTGLDAYFYMGPFSTAAGRQIAMDILASDVLKEYYVDKEKVMMEVREVASTYDGAAQLPVYGNINLPYHLEKGDYDIAEEGALAKVERIYASGASGIGLGRTEYMFTRDTAPNFAAQSALYGGILDVKDRPVTLRTFDKRDDKECIALPDVPGKYGFDYYRTTPGHEAFKTQVRAMLFAYAHSDFKNLKVMFPMVKSVDDMEFASQVIAEAKAELNADFGLSGELLDEMPFGIMVEDKDAAANPEGLLDNGFVKLSFISFGTNDLISSVKGIPRNRLKKEHFDKEIMAIMEEWVKQARSRGMSCTICGDVARLPKTVIFEMYLYNKYCSFLVSSVIQGLIPKLKTEIGFLSLQKCAELLEGWQDKEEGEIEGIIADKMQVMVERIKSSPEYTEAFDRRMAAALGEPVGVQERSGWGSAVKRIFHPGYFSGLPIPVIKEGTDQAVFADASFLLVSALVVLVVAVAVKLAFKAYRSYHGRADIVVGVPYGVIAGEGIESLKTAIRNAFPELNVRIAPIQTNMPEDEGFSVMVQETSMKQGIILDLSYEDGLRALRSHLAEIEDKRSGKYAAAITIINPAAIDGRSIEDIRNIIRSIVTGIPNASPADMETLKISMEGLKPVLAARTSGVMKAVTHRKSVALDAFINKRERALSVTTQGILDAELMYAFRDKIKARRDRMDKGADPVKELVVITDPAMIKDKAKALKYIDILGLTGYVEVVTPAELHDTVARFKEKGAKHIGIRSKEGEIANYEDIFKELNDDVIKLELAGSLDTNSYEVLLELFARSRAHLSVPYGSESVDWKNIPGLSRNDKRNVFRYLPRALPRNYEEEIRAHREAIELLLSAA